MFADPVVLLQGALAGLLFGFLLQKGGVTRYATILGQFLLVDFTVLKIMLTAIVTGAVGIYGMKALGIEFALHVKTATLLGNALGGAIFGVGMAILGYCPGTGVAALGDGSRHVVPGLLGMLCGGALYAEAHPFLKSTVLGVADLGKVTLADTGLPHWWLIAGLAVAALVLFAALERRERCRPLQPQGATQGPQRPQHAQ
jgi:uncharacterized membrane protein YedE/YeeE